MAERELTMKIVIDDSMAKEKVDALSKSLNNLESTARESGAQLTVLEAQVKSLSVNTNVTNDKSLLLRNTLSSFENVNQGWVSRLRGGLNDVAAAAGITYAGFGLMGSAMLALSSLYAGIRIGRWISDFFDLDVKIGNATASLIGWGSVNKETAGAMDDVIKRAVAGGIAFSDNATKTQKYTEAIAFNAKQAKQLSEAQKDLADSAYGWQAQLDKLAKIGRLAGLEAEIKQHVKTTKELADKYDVTTHTVTFFENQLKATTKATKTHTEAVKEQKIEIIGLGEAGENLIKVMEEYNRDALAKYLELLERIIPATRDWWTLIAQTDGEIQVLASHSLPAATGAVADFGSGVIHLGDQIVGAMDDVKESTKDTAKGVFTWSEALGGVSDILGQVHGKFGEIAGVAARAGKAIIDNLASGNVWGAVIAGATAAVQIVSKLFNFGGPSKDEKAARDAFAKQFDSVQDAINKVGAAYARMGLTGVEAQRDIQAALDATHVSANAEAAALKVINDKIALGKQATDALTEAVKKYKFTTEELGPAMARQKLDEQAKELYRDWQLLTSAGIDIAAVAREMGGAINQFLQDAIKTGTEVDISLKPMLEKMRDMGLLTDAAGNTITDLTAAGVTFSLSMSDGFKAVVGAVGELTKAIQQALGIQQTMTEEVKKTGRAADDIPDNPFKDWAPPDLPRVDYGSTDPNYGATGGLVTAMGIQHFANGGNVLRFRPRGSDTVPAMLTPGEMVLTRKQQAALMHGGGPTVNVYVDGDLNSPMARNKIARSVNQALQSRIIERRLGGVR